MEIITNWEELKSTLDRMMLEGYIFRGIKEKSEMLPKLIRKNAILAKKEIEILEEFERYYGVYGTTTNQWTFLALAQHFGLMTRLIDFTWNPYVALFFALHDQRTPEGAYQIYAIKKDKYEVHVDPQKSLGEVKDETLAIPASGPTNATSFTSRLEKAFEGIKSKKTVIVLDPDYQNNRMLAQKGLFVLPSTVEEKSVYEAFDEVSEIITINDSIRDEALKYLECIGIDEYHLMPDLGSVCYEINFQFSSGKK